MLKRISIFCLFAYSVQILCYVYTYAQFYKVYTIDDVTVKVSYGESLWVALLPGIGLIPTVTYCALKPFAIKDLNISYAEFTYNISQEDIPVNWENVQIEKKKDIIILYENSINSGRNELLIFPNKPFFVY